MVGRTLYEIEAAGPTISALLALRIICAVAEGLAHLDAHQILHAPLRLSRLLVTPNDEARLADVAVANPVLAQLKLAQHEIQTLGLLLIPMTKATALPGSGRVLKLIHRMQTSGEEALADLEALAEEAKKLEPIVAPAPLVRTPRKTELLEKVKFWGKEPAGEGQDQLSLQATCVSLGADDANFCRRGALLCRSFRAGADSDRP